MSRRFLSRRTMLRGALAGGAMATLGLPLLDAMTNSNGTALAGGGALPKRFAVWFWGNGTHPGNWAPTTLGPAWEPSALLAGLADVKDRVHVISGARLAVRGVNNPHAEGAAAILTGGNPLIDPAYSSMANDWDYMTVPAASVDEVAADVVGSALHRSMVLAVTPLHGVAGPGTAVRYTSHRGPYLFNEPTYDPAALFTRIFSGGVMSTGPTAEDLARASVLDAVLSDARSLDTRLGASDRIRLEHHLDALRDLERRVSNPAGGPVGASCMMPMAPLGTDSYRERARLMAELSAMALACDLTRVVSMEFSSPASHSGYPDIFPTGLIHNGAPISFHEYEHNVGYTPNTLTGLRYFIDGYGDFVRALKAMPEGDGTVLDSALVLGTSEVSGGQNHSFDDFPLLLAGSAGGVLHREGRHIRLEGARALATRVPLTCLRALGWTGERWGSEQLMVDDSISELFAPV